MAVTQQFGDATGYNCTAQKHAACCYFYCGNSPLKNSVYSPQMQRLQRATRSCGPGSRPAGLAVVAGAVAVGGSQQQPASSLLLRAVGLGGVWGVLGAAVPRGRLKVSF